MGDDESFKKGLIAPCFQTKSVFCDIYIFYPCFQTIRQLSHMNLPIPMNPHINWTLSSTHIRVAFRSVVSFFVLFNFKFLFLNILRVTLVLSKQIFFLRDATFPTIIFLGFPTLY